MKKVIKFKFQDKEGFLSVVEKSDYYYALVEKNTTKIQEIEHTHKLMISYELKQPVYQEICVNVSSDQELMKWVFNKLAEEKNLYFKELNENLCVLQIDKE